MQRSILMFGAAALLGLLTGSAAGQTATFDLRTSSGGSVGTFELLLSVSGGDNFGVASYSVALNGDMTFDHLAPGITTANGPSGNGEPAGFTVFRTFDQSDMTSGLTVSGGQDTVAPTPYIYYGVGQSSLNVLSDPTGGPITIVTPGDGTQAASFAATVLIGEGTWQGSPPTFDESNVDNGVQVFTSSSTLANTSAALSFTTTPIGETTSVPITSPTGVAALAAIICGLGVFAARRRLKTPA